MIDINGITSEMRCFFNKRTRQHIDYVIAFGKKLGLDLSNHDSDKYSAELIDAYTLLTWQKNHDDIILADDAKLIVKNAVKTHLKNNRHHPQAWVDVADMDDASLKEMCCDLCAMSKEFGDNPQKFFSSNLSNKYQFTLKQKKLVSKTLDFLYPRKKQMSPRQRD